jgi:hypothetical protein
MPCHSTGGPGLRPVQCSTETHQVGRTVWRASCRHAAEARYALTLLGDGEVLLTGLKAASAADFAGDERSLFRFCIFRSCIVQEEEPWSGATPECYAPWDASMKL